VGYTLNSRGVRKRQFKATGCHVR